MFMIAFAADTSKKLPRVVCRKLYHCAVIVPRGDILMMYQFTRPGRIARIRLTARDLRILGRHGWYYIYLNAAPIRHFDRGRIYTCVHLAKRAVGLRAWGIQTPYGLYKYLRRRVQ